MARKGDGACLLLSCVWLAGNAIFGLAPMVFLVLIKPFLSNQDKIVEEIQVLLKGGMILFVCCALMGSVCIDIVVNKKLQFRNFARFFTHVSPFILLLFICILYMLSIFGHVSSELFTGVSKFYVLVITFTVIYCVIGKYLLYKKED